ncbi:hypothetical protein BOTBODRAFT_26528 [Botryobasidium botryosum FD-172 SS1]|uniref:DUF7918 domain-containing protein n=1 Tax=Botryobasidium botryosum (strain FD-172 SS1) TaxID=930990 RepID=A0A067MXM4_BOTB1|nr:hypothetical protein BOTBODRAFT_26528 [Botryobasidium botryosum FD-172 SS1]
MPLNHRGYSVSIISGGRELEHFKAEIKEDDPRTISCWIPSAEGQNFEVKCCHTRDGWETMWRLYFDGSMDKAVACHSLRDTPGATKTSSGLWVSPTEIKPYIFSKLVTTEDDSISALTPSDLGTIRVSFWRVEYGKTLGGFQTFTPPTNGPIHEKSKKAGSHVVASGSAQVAATPQSGTLLSYEWIDPRNKPYGTFIFRYRPLDLLRANGIAPCPSPPPNGTNPEVVKVEGDANDSDAEEIRTLEERLNEARARRAGKRRLDGPSGTSKSKQNAMNILGISSPAKS